METRPGIPHLVLRDMQDRKRRLWPVFWISFESVHNHPSRINRLVGAIHIALVLCTALSAALVLSLFLALVMLQIGPLGLGELLPSLLLAFQKTFLFLFASLTLLFLPISIFIFFLVTLVSILFELKIGIWNQVAAIGNPGEFYGYLLVVLCGTIGACFFYLDQQYTQTRNHLQNLFTSIQTTNTITKKVKAAQLATEIILSRQWSNGSFRNFIWEQLEAGFHRLPDKEQTLRLTQKLAFGELTQYEAYLVLEYYIRNLRKPKKKKKKKKLKKKSSRAAA